MPREKNPRATGGNWCSSLNDVLAKRRNWTVAYALSLAKVRCIRGGFDLNYSKFIRNEGPLPRGPREAGVVLFLHG